MTKPPAQQRSMRVIEKSLIVSECVLIVISRSIDTAGSAPMRVDDVQCERIAPQYRRQAANCHFCFGHIDDVDQHLCASRDLELKQKGRDQGDWAWEERRKALLAKISVPTLIQEAQRLRPGHTCHGPAEVSKGAQGVIINGGNIHIVLTFDDGVKWLARIKQSLDASPPHNVQKLDQLSEIATLKVLHDAGILVPRVWTRPNEGDGGLNYFFVEFATGQAYKGFNGWQPITRAPSNPELSIIESYASFQLSVERVTFPQIGSPTINADGKVVIGPIVSDMAPLPQPPFYLGPFSCLRDRYVAYFDTVMASILEDRWCSPDRSLATYQAMLEAKRLVQGCSELADTSGPFYIKHGEAKCDHFLLDEEWSITAMLDWEWSRATSKADAFAAPLGFIPIEFFHGNNNLSLLETALAAAYRTLGREDLAKLVENGKRYQRLDNLLHGDFASFRVIKALRACFDDPQEDWPNTYREWERYCTERYSGDEGLAKLAEAALARKAAAK